MPMSDADKAELSELFSDAMAKGLAKFRSAAEEEEAKRQQNDDTGKEKKDDGGNSGGNSSGFTLPGFLLGE